MLSSQSRTCLSAKVNLCMALQNYIAIMLESPNFDIVLYQPEIPQNTGNIGRLCVGTGCRLNLVEPLGFELDEKRCRRAGLDYWPDLDLKVWPTWGPSQVKGRCFLFTKNAKRSIFDVEFVHGDTLVFGCETQGLPKSMLEQYEAQTVSFPHYGPVRSQNLSNCVSAAVYLGLKDIHSSRG
jgi:tRNA (cytidine/uridine-2'-O-)-methyltransferase